MLDEAGGKYRSPAALAWAKSRGIVRSERDGYCAETRFRLSV
jgi:hypothetical protein